ncbi:MAG TPA: integrase [Rhodobacteraceae bacterium]|nr:integrase [Paracoccaceae bacterium]
MWYLRGTSTIRRELAIRNRVKLTKTFVANVEPGDREVVWWDEAVPGLGLRVTPSGHRSYILKYRIGRGRAALARKPTLGSASDLTPDQAREIARDWKIRGKNGEDPARTQRAAGELPTVADLCSGFLAKHAVNKKTGAEDRRRIERHILGWARLGKVRVKDVNHDDMVKLHRSLGSTPYEANRTLALASKLFSLSMRHGWRADNPAAGVEKYHERPRERVLSDEEVGWFWEACTRVGYPYGSCGQLLLLTGQRLNEIARMEWAELEGDTLRLPAERSKNGRAHGVPLSSASMAVLSGVERNGSYVLTTNGRVPINGWTKGFGRIRAEMNALAGRELERWTPHDLRRTAATGIARLGIPIPVTEAVLNHVSGTTAGIVSVYQRHDYAAEKRRALEAWANMVTSIVSDEDPPVVRLVSNGA